MNLQSTQKQLSNIRKTASRPPSRLEEGRRLLSRLNYSLSDPRSLVEARTIRRLMLDDDVSTGKADRTSRFGSDIVSAGTVCGGVTEEGRTARCL
ncbi:Hypp2105 [Branchiostoma lanceolatum]|uniref:Hypp2105 protein n=1 Tax=Branchiostoma lanceolatum TaxID=7740 RepID=A0A8J9ZNS3_BRALA|nr:Hypp2105 [Branchiostoma lanceolatum]